MEKGAGASSGFGTAHDAAVHAVGITAPTRRKPKRTAAQKETYVTFDALPPHQRDNKYILGYYRSNYSVKKSLRSLFQLHNETGNIWTHLIGTRATCGSTGEIPRNGRAGWSPRGVVVRGCPSPPRKVHRPAAGCSLKRGTRTRRAAPRGV